MEQAYASTPPEKQGVTDLQPLNPTTASERLKGVDILRGVALFGILVINIVIFAQPNQTLDNPTLMEPVRAADWIAWGVAHVVFFQKFMAIFSMLFGAGLALMWERAEARGANFKKIYYRRVVWLLLFGFLHAYLLWFGDILFTYAVCGLLLYLFRRMSPRKLIIVGSIVLLVAVPPYVGLAAFFGHAEQVATEAAATQEAGEELSGEQQFYLNLWTGFEQGFNPSEEVLQELIDRYQSGSPMIWLTNAMQAFAAQTFILLTYALWRAGGLMLIGMGLMKLGVLSGARSRKFYTIMLVLGYGIGFPLVGHGTWDLIQADFSAAAQMLALGGIEYVGGAIVAFGHIALVMLFVKSRFLEALKSRLAAVGQMALTNYLMHTVVFVFIFYGWGLGLFGKIGRAELYLFVLGMWILQLYLSSFWLSRFRFGPAEWLWRSLTYGRRQPMRPKTEPPKAEMAPATQES